MKKIIVILIIMLELSLQLSSQTDMFFIFHQENRESKEWSEIISLPNTHGLDYNYPADDAPLTSGLLLLTGMSMMYMMKKMRANHTE